MSKAVINLNGTLVSPERAHVSVYDRSFLYGDSLYEVLRTYEGRLFAMEDHLDRLFHSAQLAHFSVQQSRDHLRQELERTVEEFRRREATEAYCRIVVSRGHGRIGFGLNCIDSGTFYVIYVEPLRVPTQQEFERGYRLQVSSRLRNDPQALDPAMKSGNYLNSLLAYLEATEQGFDDALLCRDGFVTEGTTFNIGYIKKQTVVTPPLGVGILEGITRRRTIELALEMGLKVREVEFPPVRLLEADEVFLTSTLREVFPVTQVDDVKIGRGGAGPITRKLAEGFRTWIQTKS